MSLTDLTRYIEQLRTFLPKTEQHSDLLLTREGVVKRAGQLVHMDPTIVKTWNKMSAKVSIKIKGV